MTKTKNLVEKYIVEDDFFQERFNDLEKLVNLYSKDIEDLEAYNNPTEIIGFGRESLVLRLDDSYVLKLFQKTPEIFRYFDLLPYDYGKCGNVDYVIQDEVEVCRDSSTAWDFFYELLPQGYIFWDIIPEQLGYHYGILKLIDYDAVKHIDEMTNKEISAFENRYKLNLKEMVAIYSSQNQ